MFGNYRYIFGNRRNLTHFTHKSVQVPKLNFVLSFILNVSSNCDGIVDHKNELITRSRKDLLPRSLQFFLGFGVGRGSREDKRLFSFIANWSMMCLVCSYYIGR